MKLKTVKKLIQKGSTLDIGCGDMRYTQHMPNPIGIDMYKEYEGIINCPDYWMDARKLEFPNETFSNVCILDTLEHVLEVDLVINQVHRVLKKNGVMIIIDPNDTFLFWARLLTLRFTQAFNGNPKHLHHFNKHSLLKIVEPLFTLETIVFRGIFTGYKFRRVG